MTAPAPGPTDDDHDDEPCVPADVERMRRLSQRMSMGGADLDDGIPTADVDPIGIADLPALADAAAAAVATADVDPATDDLLARAAQLSEDLWACYLDQVICCNAADTLTDLAAALRAAQTERDAARAVIRLVEQAKPGLLADFPGWTPAEADAITQATQDDKT